MARNSILMSCILLVFIGRVLATEPLTNQPGTGSLIIKEPESVPGDPKPLGDFESLTIPLKQAGNLFMIEARVDDEIGNLIFDTGASRLVLNKTYFRKYKSVESTNAGGVTGSVAQVEKIMVGKIIISYLSYENLMADMADLGHIENRRGIKVLGLFGFNMIKDFEVIIDYGKKELHLNRISKSGERTDPTVNVCKFDITKSVSLRNNILLLDGVIAGKSMLFCLDTGAETNILDSYAPKKVMNTVTINRRAKLQGSGGRNTEVLYGVMSELIMEAFVFKDMQTIVSSLGYMSEAFGEQIDGMLGYDFFIQGTICINLAKKELGICLMKGNDK